MAKIDLSSGDQREFLIAGFIAWCRLILKKAGGILGGQPLDNTLKDIEKIMGYISKYQSGSEEKDQIVTEIKTLIRQTREAFSIVGAPEKQKKGLFSFFS